jgi:hypothetical protein
VAASEVSGQDGPVPVPEALTRLSQDSGFWSALLTDEGAGAAVDPDTGLTACGVPGEMRVHLPVAGAYGLVLDLDLTRGEQTLGLRGPASSEPVRLGIAGPGLPPPAALTFGELELCGRVIALEDPCLPHPGLVVALLARFAPVTADDDGTAARAVLEAAFRSLRREVPADDDTGPQQTGPEQTPLPIFADDSWWPRPPRPSGQVLSEGHIAAFLTPEPRGPQVRGTTRFPAADLAELVRLARARLARLPREPVYDDLRVLPLARSIASSGDLRPVPELLSLLTEAGCDHPTVLDALSEPVVPAEACWMVETLAGAEWGTVLRRHLVGAGN